MAPPIFLTLSNFWKLNVSSENFSSFAVGIGKGFEFYWKISELDPPNLQVPQHPCICLYLSDPVT